MPSYYDKDKSYLQRVRVTQPEEWEDLFIKTASATSDNFRCLSNYLRSPSPKMVITTQNLKLLIYRWVIMIVSVGDFFWDLFFPIYGASKCTVFKSSG